MRFSGVSAAIAAAVILLMAPKAQAASPAFALEFWFNPPFSLTAPMPPVFDLDVCTAPGCSAAQSIPMVCIPQPIAPNTVGITRCSVHAALRQIFPDPKLALLGNPVNLRIRVNNLMSPVFPFMGGRPAIPEMVYNFMVAPGAGGFSVAPR